MALMYSSNFVNSPPVLLSVLDAALLRATGATFGVHASYTSLPTNVTNDEDALEVNMRIFIAQLLLPILLSLSAIMVTIPLVRTFFPALKGLPHSPARNHPFESTL